VTARRYGSSFALSPYNFLLFLKNYTLHLIDKLVSLENMISILGDPEALEKFGIRLKALRLRRNLSQEYVAGVVGISVPTYRKIEQGDGTVEFRHVARALGALGLAEALGDVIPATEPELRLQDLLRPERKHASKPRRKG
jgi:DNA-binding XRE family transcriptional regulator